jgi:homopolymeric O-antigen transport system permease protein
MPMLRRLLADGREMMTEQVEYRELLFRITYRDILIRYKQAVMGFAWALFVPLVNTVVFSVIFMKVAKIDVGMPYPLFAFCGVLAWNLFATSTKTASTSLTSNLTLVTKVYFPREIFPISGVIVSVFDLALPVVVLFGMMFWYHVPPSWTWLLAPVVLFVEILFILGVALILAMSNLFYRDVKYIFDALMTAGMFVTSVLYPPEAVGGKLGLAMRLNPMTPIIDAYRDVLFRGHLPGPDFAYATVLSLVIFAGAWVTFHRAEFRFAENV